jgi:hypothetical protein
MPGGSSDDKLATHPADFWAGNIKKILFVNMRNRLAEISISGIKGARVDYVDQVTAFGPPATQILSLDHLRLEGFAVAIATLPQ